MESASIGPTAIAMGQLRARNHKLVGGALEGHALAQHGQFIGRCPGIGVVKRCAQRLGVCQNDRSNRAVMREVHPHAFDEMPLLLDALCYQRQILG